MKNKDLKNLFLEETSKIDIQMSEKLKKTPIATKNQEPQKVVISKKKFNWKSLFLPITAVACLVVVLLTFLTPNSSKNTTSSYLTAYILEINSVESLASDNDSVNTYSNSEDDETLSIAFVTDDSDNLINIFSVNEDADEILNSEEFNDITNMTLSGAIEKVIKITSNKGIFSDYERTIKIYALNDNQNKLDQKLDNFGEFIKRDLTKFGHENIDFEKCPMRIDFFEEKMGFNKKFNKLDDMRDELRGHDRFKGEFPPPPNTNPPSNPPQTPPENPPQNPPPTDNLPPEDENNP